MGWFRKHKVCLGFYLSNKSLSACLLEKNKAAIAVLNMMSVPIEQGDGLQLAFVQIRAKLSASIQHCTLSLPVSDVMISDASVPENLTDSQIMQYLQDQQKNLFSDNPEELALDYQLMRSEQQTSLLRCVGVSRRRVDQIIHCAKQQKFILQRIGVSVFALPEVLKLCRHYISDQLQGVVLHFQEYFLVMLIEQHHIRQIKIEHSLDFIRRYQHLSNISAVSQWFYWDEQRSHDYCTV